MSVARVGTIKLSLNANNVSPPLVQTQDTFHQVLKDGTLLCEMINSLRPGSVKKINRNV